MEVFKYLRNKKQTKTFNTFEQSLLMFWPNYAYTPIGNN